MTRSPLRREFESGDGAPLEALRFATLAGGAVFLCFTAVLPLTWPHQLSLALLTLALALWINRGSRSSVATLTLMLLSIYSTFRYGFWRASTVVAYLHDPFTTPAPLSVFFIVLLLLAECYAFTVLLLGYVQVLWPLKRVPMPLPDDPEDWPAVDLLIPTLNEPLSLVRFTALAAMNIDWPADKLNVYLLDDGKREEFRAFAEEAGIGYMARDDNRHAKAGNINHALERLDSPYVAVFDCDHVPTRSFLQLTMGWFLRDAKLAMLQTPHRFYSPDPFERNLDQFHAVPNEDQLFHGVIQDGNDFWNATCFCGSCAVLRRSALDDVGGLATETVTEDAHTSLRLQKRGWNTAYINIPQAAGLATERLSGHVRQRIRWARGMVQILRIENPLFASGLKPAQRLCYFNAMAHFLCALPRLVFLTAPIIYLVFGMTSLPGYWAAIVAYAIPHLLLSNLTHSRIHAQHRHSFWNEIYETVMAPYILLPTLLALISPRWGRFNVTAKGGVVDKEFYDARIARPFLLLLAFNFFALLCAIPRFIQFPIFSVAGRLAAITNWPAHLYDGGHPGTIWINVLWTLFNLTVLGVAAGVARESQQRRQSVRVAMAVPSDVIFADGSMVQALTCDLSSGGVRMKMNQTAKAKPGDAIQFVFPVLDGAATLPATVVAVEGSEMRARFGPLTLQEDEALTMLLYSRADSWLGWGEASEPDQPLRSLGRVLLLSLRGLWQTVSGSRKRKGAAKSRLATSVVPVLLLGLLLGDSPRIAHAAQPAGAVQLPAQPSGAAASAASTASGSFDHTLTLADAGMHDALVLRGGGASRTVGFTVPPNESVKTATLKLRYAFSPALLPDVSQLNVSLNGTLVASLAVRAAANASMPGAPLESALALPAALLAHENQLVFEFIGHSSAQCEDPTNPALWARVESSSTINLAGSLLTPANDLASLPLPFYDPGASLHPEVPIVFLAPPSPKAIEAAGIVASWLGVVGGPHPVRFMVSIGTIPAGNAIVFAESAAQVPASLGVAAIAGPTVATGRNPSDPYSSVLLIAGGDADQLLSAAMALALHGDSWQGPQVLVGGFTRPALRELDDAPRWLSADREKAASLGEAAEISGESGELQGDGSIPLNATLRLPPDLDLNYGDRRNLAFHLDYRYNGVPLGEGSTLQIYVNGAYVSSTPMPHTDKASQVLETVIPVPVADLRPFANTISFQFAFQPAKSGQCAAAPPHFEGAVLRDSYLDIAEIPHWTELPNLALFAGAGYPFTRRADLADTAVVLPDQPTARELGMFLAMMGHFGAQTGYPAINVMVTDAAGMAADGARDYLVIGTAEDQPALQKLDASLPLGIDSSGLHIRDTQGFFDRLPWRTRNGDPARFGQMETQGELPDAVLEGIEWPRGSGRSVVAIVVRDGDAIPGFVDAFLQVSQTPAIAQSVSVLHGVQFSSYRLGGDSYWVGAISPLMRATILLEDSPWLIAIVAVIFCFLMAVLIQAMLRRRARVRLQGSA